MSFSSPKRIFAVLALACAQFVCAEPVSSPSSDPARDRTPSRLIEFETRAKTDSSFKARIQLVSELCGYVESNDLRTPDEFLRVVSLMGPTLGLPFEIERTQYELVLTALAKGGLDRRSMLPMSWNGLQRALGRPYRFQFPTAQPLPDPEPEDLMPVCIAKVWTDPAAASASAAQTKDNAEMQALRDADQDVRKRLGSQMDQAAALKNYLDDLARTKRTRRIVEEGALATAKDFANAALVLQHSSRFDGYLLAHELAVASMLLGDRKTGRWLVAATYDRMLQSVGHKQRFGTQYKPNEGVLPVAEDGICEETRLAVAGKSLAQQRELAAKRQKSGTPPSVQPKEDPLAGKTK